MNKRILGDSEESVDIHIMDSDPTSSACAKSRQPANRRPRKVKGPRIDARLGATSKYEKLIVFFPKFVIPNGEGAYRIGHYAKVKVEDSFFGTGLNNFQLEGDIQQITTQNVVKPVYATLDGSRYYLASLFCRIRFSAKDANVDAMVNELNEKLEMFVDKYRDSVAEEWCAQEVFKSYPDREDCPMGGDESHDNPLCCCQKNFNAKAALDALLPGGYIP